MLNENIMVNYRQKKTYNIDPLNAIGPTTSTTLRTVTTHSNNNCKYVRKFGIAYEIKSVSAIGTVPTGLTFTVKALDGTILGSRVGGSSFVAGTTLSTAQACYLAITGDGSTACGSSISISTDVDAGGKTFVLTNEVVGSALIYDFYLSQTGSTYYDINLMYGGARHTPDGTQQLPYFKISDAGSACDGSHQIVTVLDSCSYDEEITMSGNFLTLQAALGQNPKITCGVGARVTVESVNVFQNINASFWNINGSDTTGTGTWQNPYKTLLAAKNKAATNYPAMQNIVYGGTLAGSFDTVINETNVEFTTGTGWCVTAEYGLVPTFLGWTNLYCLAASGASNLVISGLIFNGINTKIAVTVDANNIIVYDCSFINCYWGIENHNIGYLDSYFKRNYFYNCTKSIYMEYSTHNKNAYIENNFFDGSVSNCVTLTAGSSHTLGGNIKNNIFSKCLSGLYLITSGSTFTLNMTITNNVFYKNSYGIYIYNSGTFVFSGTYGKNIFTENTIQGISNNIAVTFTTTYNNFYGNTSDYGANVTATNSIAADPLLIDKINNNFALKIGSPCYKTDGSEGDIGVILRSITVGASNATINGFYIDGQDQYSYGIGKTGSTDYTGLTVEWCSIYNFNGTDIDDYSGSDTLGIFKNNLLFDSGSGFNLPRGATTIKENVFYNNKNYGVYCNSVITTWDHNVLYGQQYGCYIGASGVLAFFSNSITYQNSIYGCYSAGGLFSVLYSDINDNYNSNVSVIASNNNLDVQPLFLDLTSGSENFNLKCIENGSLYNSSLIDKALDGYDIGAYIVSRTITGYAWKKYEFDYNGLKLDFADSVKGVSIVVSPNAKTSLYSWGEKRGYKISWTENQVVTETLRKKLEYFGTLIKSRANGLTDDEIKFRMHILPTQFLMTGTGTVDATEKTIADATQDWIENEFRGFHVGIKFVSGAGLVVNASAKTGTKSGATWTVNQWAGYYFYYLGYYYYIASNTEDTLTFLDPDTTLTSGTVAYAIEKYFKITSNTQNVLYLQDDDGELVSGSYAYYIDFIEVQVIDPKFNYSQPRYYYQQETWKNGFAITFEEI